MINLNEGFQGMLKVFKELGIAPGEYWVNFCEKKDSNRIQVMERKVTPACKQHWKQLRAKRKGYADADKEWEGVKYGPGMGQIENLELVDMAEYAEFFNYPNIT